MGAMDKLEEGYRKDVIRLKSKLGKAEERIATLEAKLAIYEDDHGRHCCDHELDYCRVATGLAELEKGE